MNYEILEALGQIAQEKNVSRDLVIETLEIGLLSAARKRYGAGENVDVSIDRTSGSINVCLTRQVVDDDDVEDPGLQIPLMLARELDPETEVGSELRQELNFADFGRNAIQTAKQILIQRVREAERERIYEDYQGRVGEIVSGTVQQISHGDVLVNLGRTEAVVPLKEQIRKERYRQGDPIRACLVNVLRTSKGPQLVLSRTHPNLLVKLFQLEVPEIYEGVIEIKAVAREPGERAKIAVHSNDPRIDPVGACVGMKGSRVQAVVRELGNERIDIIPWSDDEAIFLSRALSPAVVKRVVVDRRDKQMTAIVDDDQLSLAIGKSGQNARLAAQLSGWKVDIMNDTSYQAQQEERTATLVPLSDVDGIGKVTRERLGEAGIVSANDIASSSIARLTEVPGIGEATAEKIKEAASEIVSGVVEAYRKERAAREAEEKRRAEEAAAKAAAEAAAEAEQAAAAEQAAEEGTEEATESVAEEATEAVAEEATEAGIESEETAAAGGSAAQDRPEAEAEGESTPMAGENGAAETDAGGPEPTAASGTAGETAESSADARSGAEDPPAESPPDEAHSPAPSGNGPAHKGDEPDAADDEDDVERSEGGELALGEDGK